MVEYRIVPGFSRYRVGDDGSVWSKCSGEWQQLRAGVHHEGYPKVTITRDDGRQVFRLVHQLVLEAFVGPRPTGYRTEARHLDGNRLNNVPSNLAWGTPRQNSADRSRHGRTPRFLGEDHGKAKLRTGDVILVLETWHKFGVKTLAQKLGVSQSCVRAVLVGDSWRHIPASPRWHPYPGTRRCRLA